MAEGEGTSLSSSPGARLAVARKQAGLSASEAAERLHLNPQILEALEEGRLERLGAEVYARGHLKRYAQLVGVPEAEILAAYEAWSGKPASQPDLRDLITAPAVRSGTRRFALKPWHALIGAIALVVVMVVWWAMRKPTRVTVAVTPPARTVATEGDPAAPAANSPSLPLPAAEPPATAPSATPSTAVPGTAAPSAVSPVTAAPVAAAPGTSAPGTSAAGAVAPSAAGAATVRLELSFSQDSWIEISAADGARLFHGMARARSHREVSGIAPLHVFLGNPPGVTLEMNGRPVLLAGNPKPRRFTLDDAGNVAAAAADRSDKGSAAQPRSD